MSTWSPTREKAQAREHARLQEAVSLASDLKEFMGHALGRRIVWRLLEATGALQPSIANNTATVQSGLVALRDFGMQQLVLPLMDVCPDLFLRMRAENGGSTADG